MKKYSFDATIVDRPQGIRANIYIERISEESSIPCPLSHYKFILTLKTLAHVISLENKRTFNNNLVR